MRILYVLTSLGIGGAERQVLAIADRMAARGHAVAVLVLRPPVAEQWPTQIPVHHLNLGKNPLSFCAAFLRARRFLREFRPDLLHSHGFHANIFTRLLKTPAPPQVVSTIHNVYEGGRLRMFAYRLTDSLSTRTTAVSTAAAERFVRLKAVPANKITVVPNAIDTAEFAPDPQRRQSMRSDMGAGDAFIWLAVGRLVPAKDFPNLLRAFAAVHARYPAAQLWIAGQPASPEFERIQALSQALELGGCMQCLGLRRDIPALLDAADAFVLSSAWEGMPLALGEAMAMEKPIVATDVGGVRELVGSTANLVPAQNAERLASAMLDLMQATPEERRARATAGRLRVQSGFSIETRAAEWEALYSTLIQTPA